MIPNQLEVISKGKHWSTTQNPYFSVHTRSVSAHGAVYFFLIYILGILALTNRHYLLLALKSEFSLKVTIKNLYERSFLKLHNVTPPHPPPHWSAVLFTLITNIMPSCIEEISRIIQRAISQWRYNLWQQ